MIEEVAVQNLIHLLVHELKGTVDITINNGTIFTINLSIALAVDKGWM